MYYKTIKDIFDNLTIDRTLVLIKCGVNEDIDELFEDIEDVFENIKCMYLDVENTNTDTVNYLEENFIDINKNPSIILYDKKEIKKVYNSFNNVEWIETFVQGDSNE